MNNPCTSAPVAMDLHKDMVILTSPKRKNRANHVSDSKTARGRARIVSFSPGISAHAPLADVIANGNRVIRQSPNESPAPAGD